MVLLLEQLVQVQSLIILEALLAPLRYTTV